MNPIDELVKAAEAGTTSPDAIREAKREAWEDVYFEGREDHAESWRRGVNVDRPNPYAPPTATAEVGPDAEGGTTEMRWIACSERLPEVRQKVLIYIAASEYDTPTEDFGELESNGSWDVWNCVGIAEHEPERITHWMPLPTPPTATAKETNDES